VRRSQQSGASPAQTYPQQAVVAAE
jgi:hypothetical protein